MPDAKGTPLKLGTPQGWDGGLSGVGRESEARYQVRSAPPNPQLRHGAALHGPISMAHCGQRPRLLSPCPWPLPSPALLSN